MSIINQEIRDNYAIYNADCMEVLPIIPDESVGLSVYSPPFPELYQYSNDPRDMSNCTNYQEGIEQYKFIVEQIHRVTMPGRISCVHCMDLKRGQRWQRDFPGDIVRIHEAAGFHHSSRVTIWKDPWLIARRTRMRSLMHKTIVNDCARAHPAGPDYILVFEKGGENPMPITHKSGFQKYAGGIEVPESFIDDSGKTHPAREYDGYAGDQRKNLRSHWIWRQYASPVWMDIRGGRLLPYTEARESEEEKHVCPLQLDVIDRCLEMWSNLSDIVLTPFMGVGSEVYSAVVAGRMGLGVELKTTYYDQAKKNIAAAIRGRIEELSLDFEMVDASPAPALQTTEGKAID